MALDGRSPILHLEMHGDEAGLQVASGETLHWTEIAPALVEINERTRMNLLVVAAACHGWHLSEILRPVDRAPAWAIIGPPDLAQAGALYEAMRRFYDKLISKLDLREALNVMNGSAEISEWSFRMQSADLLYCQVFRHYMTTGVEDESHEQRVNRLVADVARAQQLDVSQTMQLRAKLGSDLSNNAFWFDRYRTNFLMLDLFPENAHRFPLGFDECTRTAV